MINFIKNLLRPKTVSGIVADINRKIAQLRLVGDDKEAESDYIRDQIQELAAERIAAESERSQAYAIADKLQALIS